MKGNRGEWSELYVFFKLLAEGKLFSADENLEKTESFVQLLSIYRKDAGKNLNFKIASDQHIHIIDANTEQILLSFPQSKAKLIANNLVSQITGKTGISKELIASIKELFITQVADKSLGKGDINVRVYDPIHAISSDQEFSIKSFLGSDPTLFNANKTTNITYRIIDANNLPISDEDLKEVNGITTGHKYIKRISKLTELGYKVVFDSYDDNTFKLNLQVIDSDLPEIIAHIVKDKYVSSIVKINEVIVKIREDNPMNYDLSQGHKFYEYRLVNFLVEAALGMTSKSVWSGKYDIVGGIIIIKPNSEMLCYHLIDFNKFKQYLKNSSRLDNPSGSKMGYGTVYKNYNGSFIKLNFQIKA
ncbi:HpaII family restriction endonuclease [Aquimarina sp. 2201CG14-23]|uniref:HpaII family restriction endonuclease n=1 Tax=Aquimarina mycalae TaxID=3040073 RepID=UPI0024782765|nr:HpaII family restriction endonuclease [Aquimarina sp. 2201CG14-23]MDH7444944.1 HpaII family restriction endonuclease [Aquimarina sp. 2201CG14-23]